MISIDSREPKDWQKRIIKQCKKRDIDHEIRALKCGDYESNKAIVERKEISDLYNSLISNRLYNQISRLSKHAYNNSKFPCLVIHGKVSKLYKLREQKILKSFNVDTLYGVCSSLSVRYMVNIVWVDSVTAASRSIVGVLTKADNGKVLKNDWSIDFMKCRLLGVSEKEYERLLSRFGSFKNILDADIDDLVKVRGIGKVKAKRILEVTK